MTRRILTAIAVAGMVTVLPQLQADHHQAEQAAELIERMEAAALDIRFQAARIRTYLRAPDLHTWRLHADTLSRIEAEIEDIQGFTKQFDEIKADATDRQGKAFNQIVPLATQIADQVGKAIQVVNTEREEIQVGHPDYEEHIDSIYNKADEMVAIADSAESWYETKQENEES